MNATATHDTKRGEDMRARINVLSELPERWEQRVNAWRKLNRARQAACAKAARFPTPTTSISITRRCSAPIPSHEGEHESFVPRLRDYLRQGGARSRRAHRLAEAATRSTSRASWPSSTRPSNPHPKTTSLRDFLPFQREDRPLRRFELALADAAQADLPRRARHLPGHGAVGSQPRRSRQPPAGGLRQPRADARRNCARGRPPICPALLLSCWKRAWTAASSSLPSTGLCRRGGGIRRCSPTATTCRCLCRAAPQPRAGLCPRAGGRGGGDCRAAPLRAAGGRRRPAAGRGRLGRYTRYPAWRIARPLAAISSPARILRRRCAADGPGLRTVSPRPAAGGTRLPVSIDS